MKFYRERRSVLGHQSLGERPDTKSELKNPGTPKMPFSYCLLKKKILCVTEKKPAPTHALTHSRSRARTPASKKNLMSSGTELLKLPLPRAASATGPRHIKTSNRSQNKTKNKKTHLHFQIQHGVLGRLALVVAVSVYCYGNNRAASARLPSS